MTDMFRPRLRYVLGPDGSPLTIADLPPPNTKRWVIRRKAEVVAAVRGGLLSLEDACKRYKLTIDEFLSWQRLIDRHGLPGLRATKVQDTETERAVTFIHHAFAASAPRSMGFEAGEGRHRGGLAMTDKLVPAIAEGGVTAIGH